MDYDEYRSLLDSKFAGVRPKNLSDLDPFIFVKVPGTNEEVPYTQVRSPNDHKNAQGTVASGPAATAASSAAASSAAASSAAVSSTNTQR